MVVIPSSEPGKLSRILSLTDSEHLKGESSSDELDPYSAQSLPVSPVGPSHIITVAPESLMSDAQQYADIKLENKDLGITMPPFDSPQTFDFLFGIAYLRCSSNLENRDISKGIKAMKLAIKLSATPKKKAELSRHLLEWVMKSSSNQAQLNELTKSLSQELFVAAEEPQFKPQDPEAFPKEILVSSYDLKRHPVSDFCLPLLEALSELKDSDDQPLYKISFLFVGDQDEVTKKYQKIAENTGGKFEHKTLLTLDLVELGTNFSDGLHACLDLSGYSHSIIDLPIVMANAAKSGVPVFNYCGFPGELGLKGPGDVSGYSHQFTDATLVSDSPLDMPHVLPNPFNRKHVKGIRFEDGFLSPYDDFFEVEIEPNSRTHFAYVNHLAKLTKETFQLFADILDANSESILTFQHLSFQGLEDSVKGKLVDLCTSDVTGRIHFLDSPDESDYFHFMTRPDIFLDPYPYNGTTTIANLLSMGRVSIVYKGDTPPF